MVSEGDAINSGFEKFIGDLGGYSDPGSAVFAIDDKKCRLKLLFEEGEFLEYGVSAGFSDNVTKKEDAVLLHGGDGTRIYQSVWEKKVWIACSMSSSVYPLAARNRATRAISLGFCVN